MIINNELYSTEEKFELQIADSFTLNKLASTTGKGNIEIYLPEKTFNSFFGEKGKQLCCYLKEDLKSYFEKGKSEFFSPSQQYRHLLDPIDVYTEIDIAEEESYFYLEHMYLRSGPRKYIALPYPKKGEEYDQSRISIDLLRKLVFSTPKNTPPISVIEISKLLNSKNEQLLLFKPLFLEQQKFNV